MHLYNYHRYTTVYAAILCFLLIFQPARGADIAHEVRQGSNASLALEIGFGLGVNKVPVVGFVSDDPDDPRGSAIDLEISLAGRAEWRGFFAEIIAESLSGGALGYSLWESDFFELDFVVTEGFGSFEPNIGEYSSLDERDSDLLAGLRSSHYFGNKIVQLDLYSDIRDLHGGQIAGIQLGQFWQIRNWNLHAIVGLRYFSAEVLDYYIGISEDESTANIPSYDASGGTLSTLEIGSTLPLNEKWIFKSTAEVHYLPDAIADSPLTNGRIASSITTSFNYVF